ncbi:hypothetical protein LMG29739_00253 [Paraburkholderia solisilvae]|uniref:Uncharacterized protein n=1 Tax=Paraburkholderia solisilvae TaxID=624376 RepID=A0A6J5D1Z1_9BURK|nr:hypothetical protein LMG29739_00253 [Paraburkholderia solisilvae]
MSAPVLPANTGIGARVRAQFDARGRARRAIHPTMNK